MSTDLRKRKITYTIILTSDSPAAHHRRMHIKTGALAVVSFVVFVAVICYAVYTTITMGGYIERNAKQLKQLVQMKTENETLPTNRAVDMSLDAGRSMTTLKTSRVSGAIDIM